MRKTTQHTFGRGGQETTTNRAAPAAAPISFVALCAAAALGSVTFAVPANAAPQAAAPVTGTTPNTGIDAPQTPSPAVAAAVSAPPDASIPATLPTSTALPFAPQISPSQIPVTPQPNSPTPPTPRPTKTPDETVTSAKPSDAKPTTVFGKGTTPGQPLPDDPATLRTLDDALTTAFRRSPAILEAQERAYHTKRQVDQLLSIKKPQISASGTYSRLANESSQALTAAGASPASIVNPFSTTLAVTPPGTSPITLSTSGGTSGGAGSSSLTSSTLTNNAATGTSSSGVSGSTGSSGGSTASTRSEGVTRQQSGGTGTTTPGGGTTTTTNNISSFNSAALNQVNARVSVSQLIDITNLVKVAEDIGNLEETLSRIDLARTRQQTALTVKTSYYNLLRAQAFVNVDESAVADSQETLRVTQAQFAAGLASQYDVLRARTQLDNNRQALISARNQVAIYKNALANTVGIDPSTPVDPQPLPVPPLPALDEATLIQQAFKQRPEYLEADINLLVAQKNIRLAHRNLDPYMNAGVSGSYNATASAFTQSKGTASFGLTLTVPLYDGGATRASEDQARSDARGADIQKDQFVRGIKAEVQQAVISVRDANERSLAIASTVTSGEEALRLAGVRFRAGVGTQLDVNDAQSALVQAQNNQVSALFDYLGALARLSLAVGNPE